MTAEYIAGVVVLAIITAGIIAFAYYISRKK